MSERGEYHLYDSSFYNLSIQTVLLSLRLPRLTPKRHALRASLGVVSVAVTETVDSLDAMYVHNNSENGNP